MRNRYFIGLLMIAGSLLSLVSCEKEPSGISKSGSIPFVVSSGSPQTKTAYSGDGEWEGEGANRRLVWERINWKEGEDHILIWSDNAMNNVGEESHQAIYVVGAPTIEGENKISRAPVQKKATDELFFQEGETTYTFWGFYPANSNKDLDNDKVGAIEFTVPASQSNDGSTTADGVTTLGPDMSNAFMLAKVNYTTDDELVELPFYPAFTAFEFTLVGGASEVPLKSIVLSADSPLSGDVNATLDAGTRTNSKGKVVGKSKYSFVDSDTDLSSDEIKALAAANTITFTFPDNTVVSEDNALTFTVFALPRDITNLTLEFHMGANGTDVRKGVLTVKTVDSDTGDESFTPLTFGECEKHRIKGILVENIWKFEYLTLDISPLDWVPVKSEISSGDGVQATQFNVIGASNLRDLKDAVVDASTTMTDDEKKAAKDANKAYRQWWVFPAGDAVTVTYKIMMPLVGTWAVEPLGDTDAFTVTSSTGALTGNLAGANASATYITLTITGTGTAQKSLYLKTTVTSNGETYNLDSETQLYDMRGYHYFIVNGDVNTNTL